MTLNWLIIYGKNYATGCSFLKKKLCDRVLQLIRKLCDGVSCGRTLLIILLKQWIVYTFSKILMRQDELLRYFKCDRLEDVERFAHTSVTSLVKCPPPKPIQRRPTYSAFTVTQLCPIHTAQEAQSRILWGGGSL